MDKVLIAQIGKSTYINTTYKNPEGDESDITTTGYTFDAIVKKENPNKLLLIGTLMSNWIGVISWYGIVADGTLKKEEESLIQVFESEEKLNAQSEVWGQIENFIKQAAGFAMVKIAIVPNGETNQEQIIYFESLKNALEVLIDEESTEVIFDISNGYRSMPLYIMMLVKYMGLIAKQEITYKSYYGMFEASDKDNKTPLVNMTEVVGLTEWINAISEFRNFGSVKALYQCLQREADNKVVEDRKDIEDLIEFFERFDYAANANNLYELERSINEIKKLEVKGLGLSKAAELMLEALKQEFMNRFPDSSYPLSNLQVRLSILYKDQGKYSSAAIAIQESVTTYVMERYLKEQLLECDKEKIDKLGGFEWYITDYKYRNPVTIYFNEQLGKHQNEFKTILASGKISKEYDAVAHERKYPFDALYLKIKDNLRNIGAHLLYSKKTESVSVNEMVSWLEMAQKTMLADMQDEEKPEICTGLCELYKEYQVDNNVYEKLWAGLTSDETDTDWLNKITGMLREEKVDLRKVQQLKIDLDFVKEQCRRKITCDEIKARTYLYQLITFWIETENKVWSDTIAEKKLRTKKNDKGVEKTGYESLKNFMKNRMKGIAEKILHE